MGEETKKKKGVKIGKGLKIGLTFGVTAVLLICVAVGCGKKKADKSLVTVDEAITSITLEEILKPASEVVSMKYCYTDADFYEQSKQAFGIKVPFTTDKVVFTYTGIISAGIEMSEIEYDVNSVSKVIKVTLPEPKILSHQMNEKDFKFFDVKNSVFTETNLEDYASLMDTLKESKETKLKEDETFMKAVTENAQTVINDFFSISELTKGYTIEFE